MIVQHLRPALALWLLASSASLAAVPPFDEVQLQVRANLVDGFNLPAGASMNSATPSLGPAGLVAIKVSLPAATLNQGVWLGMDGSGGVVINGLQDAILSDPDIGGGGLVVFPQQFSAGDGLYFYDAVSMLGGLFTTRPIGTSTWGSPEANTDGQVGFRAGFSTGQAFVSMLDMDDTSPAFHALEVSLEPLSPYSFLFTPSFNDQRRIAAKVRLGGPGQVGGSQPDEIRIFASDGSSELIAEDQDSDNSSPYLSFDNSVSLTHDGRVAFVAGLDGGVRGVFLSDGALDIEIAREGTGDISEIEFFAPAANSNGWVAFRAFDGSGLRAVFVGDGDGPPRKVVREHDLVTTDLGEARIDQNDGSPTFGGSPDLSEAGEVAFVATLTPPDNDQIEWGSGLFIAGLGTVFEDDFESGNLDAWASTSP